jgi:hypothetical protein
MVVPHKLSFTSYRICRIQVIFAVIESANEAEYYSDLRRRSEKKYPFSSSWVGMQENRAVFCVHTPKSNAAATGCICSFARLNCTALTKCGLEWNASSLTCRGAYPCCSETKRYGNHNLCVGAAVTWPYVPRPHGAADHLRGRTFFPLCMAVA